MPTPSTHESHTGLLIGTMLLVLLAVTCAPTLGAGTGMHYTMDAPGKGTQNEWTAKHRGPLVVVMAPKTVQISVQAEIAAPFSPSDPASFHYLSINLIPKKYEGSILAIAQRLTTGTRVYDKRYKTSTPVPFTVSGTQAACFREALVVNGSPAKGIAFLVPCKRGYYLLTFRADPQSYSESLYKKAVESFRVTGR
jgi:hypothetical protein